MTKKKLKEILEKHKKWLNHEEGGEQAKLLDADLRGANLRSADLRSADLRCVDLSDTDLRFARLGSADLRNAQLNGADLRYADLTDANLGYSNLRNAILAGAHLAGVTFSYLEWDVVPLYTQFEGADLRGVELDESQKIRRGIYLKEPMMGYKKCRDNVVVTLEIPAHAIVFSINNEKCRTNVAKVIDIDGGLDQAESIYDRKFIYRKGEMVYPDTFDCMYNIDCGGGIHFFRTRQEAERYR
jgi:hypothetical protein